MVQLWCLHFIYAEYEKTSTMRVHQNHHRHCCARILTTMWIGFGLRFGGVLVVFVVFLLHLHCYLS
jgi:hypothetical protein